MKSRENDECMKQKHDILNRKAFLFPEYASLSTWHCSNTITPTVEESYCAVHRINLAEKKTKLTAVSSLV